jgi:hypothetical protein
MIIIPAQTTFVYLENVLIAKSLIVFLAHPTHNVMITMHALMIPVLIIPACIIPSQAAAHAIPPWIARIIIHAQKIYASEINVIFPRYQDAPIVFPIRNARIIIPVQIITALTISVLFL